MLIIQNEQILLLNGTILLEVLCPCLDVSRQEAAGDEACDDSKGPSARYGSNRWQTAGRAEGLQVIADSPLSLTDSIEEPPFWDSIWYTMNSLAGALVCDSLCDQLTFLLCPNLPLFWPLPKMRLGKKDRRAAAVTTSG